MKLTKEEALIKIKELEEYIKNIDKELKLYDVVNYCNHDWYVIKIEEEYVTLMSKNAIGTCAYNNNNSNDWKDSNCIKLLNEFMSKLNADDLMLMKVNYDEDKFTNSIIRIPTLREIEAMPMDVRKCEQIYWTMTSSIGVGEYCTDAEVFYVYLDGFLYNDWVANTNGVRPVIRIKKECL